MEIEKTNYAIFRVKKISSYGNIGGSLSHTFRTRETLNADENKTKFNRVICGSHNSEDVISDIKSRIDEITKQPRKNAVLAIELLQTYSPDSKISLDEWVEENNNWNKKTFGEKNVISSVLHLDETTPHIVTYVVPEKDGKLNCRGILGGSAKLSQLQTSYATTVEKFGLERGKIGSKAKHKTIKQYYASVNSVDKIIKNNKSKLDSLTLSSELPNPSFFESKQKYKEKLEELNKENIKLLNNIFKNNKKILLQNKELREKLIMKEKEIKNLREENIKLDNTLESIAGEEEISKEDISVLRKLDISLVAQRLEYFGTIPKKFNAIDLVKQVNNFNFEESVNWLYNEFGSDNTGAIVANYVAVNKPERPFTKAENTIKNEVVKQLDSLGCDRYRITLQSDEVKPYLPGKPHGKNSEEFFYSREDIINMIPYLLVKNNSDKMNVLITPMDDNCYYILVDDCKKNLQELEENGFQPCLYQSTSWNSYQAVFKLPKEIYDREKEILPLFNMMNKQFGDEKMTGLRHPFRLAGFRNMKPKHLRDNGERPFVTIKKAINTFCQKCMDFLNNAKLKENLQNNKAINKVKIELNRN